MQERLLTHWVSTLLDVIQAYFANLFTGTNSSIISLAHFYAWHLSRSLQFKVAARSSHQIVNLFDDDFSFVHKFY